MNFLTVDLYNDFQCVAGVCPDTCCAGWTINMDDETYRKMEENEEILGISVSDWIIKNSENRTVRLDHRRCPMLDEHNLCKVVSRLGPEYLSSTCAGYPRKQHQYGNIIEGYLAFSCPEVVAGLMDKRELQFDFTTDRNPDPEEPYPYEQLYLYESAVRNVMVDIFQNSAELSLHTKVAFAFDILEKAILLYKNGQTDFCRLEEDIAWYFQDNRLYIMDAGLREAVSEESRYHFLQKIQLLIDVQNGSELFLEMVRQVKEYFSRNDLEQYLDDVQKFKRSQSIYQDFHHKYWMYRIFSDLIHVPDFEKAKENYLCIAAGFCLAQIMALVACRKEGTLEKETYICILSNISRMMEHNKTFKETVVRQMDGNHINGLAGLLLLVF